jgi:hypothetical protein
MGDKIMKFCIKCSEFKPNDSFCCDWDEVCLDCASKARQSFYNRVTSGETCKHTNPNRKVQPRPPKRAPGSIHKRCPSCKTHVYVDQTEPSLFCWKCGAKFDVAKALRDTSHHRGGVILNEVR